MIKVNNTKICLYFYQIDNNFLARISKCSFHNRQALKKEENNLINCFKEFYRSIVFVT